MKIPYKNKDAIEKYQRILGDAPYTPNRLYKRCFDGNLIVFYVNQRGYMHFLIAKREKIANKKIFSLYDYCMTDKKFFQLSKNFSRFENSEDVKNFLDNIETR